MFDINSYTFTNSRVHIIICVAVCTSQVFGKRWFTIFDHNLFLMERALNPWCRGCSRNIFTFMEFECPGPSSTWADGPNTLPNHTINKCIFTTFSIKIFLKMLINFELFKLSSRLCIISMEIVMILNKPQLSMKQNFRQPWNNFEFI